jgi:hypothetical protein
LSCIQTTWTRKVSPLAGDGSLSFKSWRNKRSSSLQTSDLFPLVSTLALQGSISISIPIYQHGTLPLPVIPVVAWSSTTPLSIDSLQVHTWKGHHPSQFLLVRYRCFSWPVFPLVTCTRSPLYPTSCWPTQTLLPLIILAYIEVHFLPLKCCCPTTLLHSVTIQKTVTWLFTAMKTSSLACKHCFHYTHHCSHRLSEYFQGNNSMAWGSSPYILFII